MSSSASVSDDREPLPFRGAKAAIATFAEDDSSCLLQSISLSSVWWIVDLPLAFSRFAIFRSRGARYEQSAVIKAEALFGNEVPLSLGKVPRRLLVGFVGLIPSIACTVPSFALPAVFDIREREDIVEGSGAEAHEGDLVQPNYVCRPSNGYFVQSTVVQFSGESMPVALPSDESLITRGLKEVLIGMGVGGKRRGLIPSSAGYIDETLRPIPEEFGPRRSLLSHVKETLIFEVRAVDSAVNSYQLLAVERTERLFSSGKNGGKLMTFYFVKEKSLGSVSCNG